MKKSLTVKNIIPGLPECGKIKIGCKGKETTSSRGKKFQLPERLDHFRITTLERDAENNFIKDAGLHGLLGDEPKSIPIILLFDDILLNFTSRYACYKGKTLLCSGDGETAERLATKAGDLKSVDCPCEHQNPDYAGENRCKINGVLSCIISGAEKVGGAWKFRTTSYNSVVNILSSLTLIQRITGGPLAGIPLNMVIRPKACLNPVSGASQTVQVVALEYAGGITQLKQTGFNILLENKKLDVKVEQIENVAKNLISAEISDFDDGSGDTLPEFYPEGQTGAPKLAAPAPETAAKPAETTPQAAKPAPAAQPDAPAPETAQNAPDGAQAAPPKRRGRGRPPKNTPATAAPDAATAAKPAETAPEPDAPAPVTPESAPAAQPDAPESTPQDGADPGPDAPAPEAGDDLDLFN